jgi:hypothetical protein
MKWIARLRTRQPNFGSRIDPKMEYQPLYACRLVFLVSYAIQLVTVQNLFRLRTHKVGAKCPPLFPAKIFSPSVINLWVKCDANEERELFFLPRLADAMWLYYSFEYSSFRLCGERYEGRNGRGRRWGSGVMHPSPQRSFFQSQPPMKAKKPSSPIFFVLIKL